MVRVHRLVLVDRGAVHRHRWDATCTCGWIAVHRRRKYGAKLLHRQHVEGLHSRVERRRMTPRPPTAATDLPEPLQRSVEP